MNVQCVNISQVLNGLLADEPELVFIPNPGNAGDALINVGTWQCFDKSGISQKIVRPFAAKLRRVYLYPGGGNLIEEYSNARIAIQTILESSFEKFVILPHTIRGNEALLRRFDSRFHVFCRDVQTYEHVKSNAGGANLYMAHDIGFQVSAEELFNRFRYIANLLRLGRRPQLLRRYLHWKWKIRDIKPENGRLLLMRVDVEKPATAACRDPRRDLSACYGGNFSDRMEAELISYDFLKVISNAKLVETDRLHVGIGACLIGRSLLLHDNSYGKNRAVFEMSIKDRYVTARFTT